MRIPLDEAKSICINAQGLGGSFGQGKEATLTAIRHLSYVQIDTISVVERAHHHVLWSRVPNYKPEFLADLVQHDRAVLEYWSHAAAFLPMEDYRFCLPRMNRFANGEAHWFIPTPEHAKLRKHILVRIKKEGGLKSSDFEAPNAHKGGWFERKPAKQMLEQLFMEGKLLITRREGFQKVYDLAERVLPDSVNRKMPTPQEFSDYLVFAAVRSSGLIREKEISYLRRNTQESVSKSLAKLVKSGEIDAVEVRGINDTYFCLPNRKLNKLMAEIQILSPFDNFVIQRNRLKDLFQFDYQIECYVPAPKRKFGYFSLPLLYMDRFVGRVDLKAERKTKTLLVQSLHWEKKEKGLDAELQNALAKFASFNRCEKIAMP